MGALRGAPTVTKSLRKLSDLPTFQIRFCQRSVVLLQSRKVSHRRKDTGNPESDPAERIKGLTSMENYATMELLN